MTKDELRRCQLKQLEALKFIDKICKENGLKYFAHTGTLLGAARHHGYIPWDMDTDILMPETDAKRFMGIIKCMKSEIYAVIEKELSWSCSDRLIAKNVQCYGAAALTDVDKYIHIDIYSYGNAKRKSSRKSKWLDWKARLLHRIIEYRYGRNLFQSNLNRVAVQLGGGIAE